MFANSIIVKGLDVAIEREEKAVGYLRARFAVDEALREGFRTKAAEAQPDSAALLQRRGSETLSGAYRSGGVAAFCNYRTRPNPQLVEPGEAPFDTDTARRMFDAADALIG